MDNFVYNLDMKFKQITDTEFQKFAAKHPNKSFFQTVEIAKLREKNGWQSHYLAVEENGKLLAATMLVSKPTFLGKSIFYAPGGPLVDYEDKKVLSFFISHLTDYVKSHGGYVLRIEPYYELIERDRDGEIVEGGFNREAAAKNLESLGFKKTTPENPVYSFVLDLKGREEKELFSSFKQNTRNLISRTARKGIKVRELGKDELGLFKTITESTASRRDFSDKSLAYYETMYDLFAGDGKVKFLVAEVGGGTGDAILRQSAVSVPSPTCTPLSVAMFMTYGDEVIYLFSGSDEKYMKEYNAQYAIQWYMIKYALEHGFKRYNFYGIQGLPDTKKPGYGIYLFKKGFGGHVTELLGAYELPVNKPIYHLHKLLSSLKHH